jgi:hypothetical protein
MDIVAKIAHVLLTSEFPMDKVRRILTEAYQTEQTDLAEVHQLVAEHLVALAAGGAQTMRSGRVLQRKKCIEALERMRNWTNGGEAEAAEIMSWKDGDPPPSMGEYADWVLRYG